LEARALIVNAVRFMTVRGRLVWITDACSGIGEALADAIERETAEFTVGGWEVANVYLKRFLPGLLRRLLRLQEGT
jgi:hypothetical protein